MSVSEIFKKGKMLMTQAHVEHRYSQVEAAHLRRLARYERLYPLSSPQYHALSRRDADQMTRICRRAQRMIRSAS
jgi:hypothetical protein